MDGYLFGYFGSSLYWISISLTFDENFKFLLPFTLVLIPAFLSIFYGLVSYLFLLFRFKKSINSFLFFSLVFALLEFIRGSILTGFPWNLIAFSFSNQLEILSIVTLIGTYGFNLFCISLFASPALLILRNNRINIFVPIFLFICFVIFYFYGNSYKQKFYNNADKTLEYKVRLIGSNVSLDRFYSNANSILILENLIKISNLKFDEKTILVWPEAAIPDISQKELKEYKWLFEKNFNNNHYLIIGINSDSVNNGIKKYFNSFSLYDGDLN